MTTPCELLERIAADVAPHVPGNESIVHVEVGFAQQPPEVEFKSTPYDRKTLYDLALRTPLTVPEPLAKWVRDTASEYFDLAQPLNEQDLVFLRVSVTNDGSFFMGQSCKQRPEKP